MSQPPVHSFYRIWFTWVDPLVTLPTVYMVLYDRAFFMEGFIPASMSVADPRQGFLYHAMAALYAFVTLMLGGTLRVTSELSVWKMVVGGVLMIDVALMASQYVSIEEQGRLTLDGIRWQDLAGFALTAGVTLIRAFFLAGVGVGSPRRGVKSE